MQIPFITTEQMIEVDRLMIEEYGIQLIQMMENAGRNLAELSRQILGGDLRGKRIAILCGAGNNGGGGMVAARHLHNWGAGIMLKVLSRRKKLNITPKYQFHILKKMEIRNRENIDLDSVNLVIDAMIGYGLIGDPRGSIADWIQRVNSSACPVLSLDIPSGLNTTTGFPGNPCVRATATMTLALPKSGLTTSQAKPFVGDLYLADIGVPPELYAAPSLGLEVGHIFIQGTIQHMER
jgi:NAD(P)H-hydrate epimerase